jgi:UDP-N-acetyl-D-galactosamine dehydrogenase
MYNNLKNKTRNLSVVGLGYVGLPLALEFAGHISVIGFDIDENRLSLLRKGIDPGKELSESDFRNKDISFTSSEELLKEAVFHVIAVPTPINEFNLPDLSPLISASETIGRVLKKGDYVVYESTVYPGCTEEECIPVLEKVSGLKAGVDFKVGYSPERINPGDKVHTLKNTVKIVSGCDDEALNTIADVYSMIVDAGVHRAASIKVAEAAKIIENTQRDVNIALMNELSIICNRLNINTYEVLDAAKTKWNFLNFSPGLVGGHCIGVDPYYLAHKAMALKYHPQMINAGRYINDTMGGYIGKKIVKKMIEVGGDERSGRALIFGFTFKENVTDVRNTKVADIVRELKDYGVESDIVDPHVDPEIVLKEYGLKPVNQPNGKYDIIVVAVAHKEFSDLDESYFKNYATRNAVFVDIKGLYRGRINDLEYWSL